MKDLSRIKIIPIALVLLIIVGVFYIIFRNRSTDLSSTEDTTNQIDELTPLVKTIDVTDSKTEQIKGLAITLPGDFIYTTIINEPVYRGMGCEDTSCLIYMVNGNREFMISNSKLSNLISSKSAEDMMISLRGNDYTFSAITYYATAEDGSDDVSDKRVSFLSGCIEGICFASDQMDILNKENNTLQIEEFKKFINELTIN